MRLPRLFLLWSTLVCVAAMGQTYTPKQIKLQGAEGLDQAELLRILALKPGAPVSKAEIETALQRLADTGSFEDLSYRVDANTLLFVLKPAEGAQAMPVRFSNFVWWQPGELEPLVRARVPLFEGKLPLTGSLTNQVIAALKVLLEEKGVPNAQISASPSSLGAAKGGIGSIVLALTSPTVTVGDIVLSGAAVEAQAQLSVVTSKLAGRDFDVVMTSAEIHDNVLDTHLNAGFLDATVNQPLFGPPRKEMFGYTVDAIATVKPGALYRISAIDFTPAPPVPIDEAGKAIELNVGDPAGAMGLKIAEGSLTQAYVKHGHQEAHVQGVAMKDMAKHTAAYRFSISPGPLDRFAAVDISALPPEMQAQFSSVWHGQAGVPADSEVTRQLYEALRSMSATNSVKAMQRLDRKDHTVTLVLLPATGP